jgi:hypothetical protein
LNSSAFSQSRSLVAVRGEPTCQRKRGTLERSVPAGDWSAWR